MLTTIMLNALINYVLFNFVYYLTSTILFIVDYYKFFYDKKIQIIQTDIVSCYKIALPVVLQNTLVATILPLILLGYYEETYTDAFCITKFIIDIVLTFFMTDVLFYIVHRIFHLPFLYQKFHKRHHQIIAPVGFSALYMTIPDLYFGNILPIYLPIYIMNAHPITIKCWLVMITIDTILLAHSGFSGISDYHDHHHSQFNKNYGTNVFMDKLFGTYYTKKIKID